MHIVIRAWVAFCAFLLLQHARRCGLKAYESSAGDECGKVATRTKVRFCRQKRQRCRFCEGLIDSESIRQSAAGPALSGFLCRKCKTPSSAGMNGRKREFVSFSPRSPDGGIPPWESWAFPVLRWFRRRASAWRRTLRRPFQSASAAGPRRWPLPARS